MKSLFHYLIISSSCFFMVTNKRRSGSTNLDTLYSDEDPEDISTFTLFSSQSLVLRGNIRRYFALTAALDKQDQNVICSPLSALMPLGKLVIGARDEALNQLLRAIGIDRKRKLKAHFKPLVDDLMYLPGAKLTVSSRMYYAKKRELSKSFIDIATYIFGSSAEKVDFSRPFEAAETINSWVRERTNGMIRNLVSPSEISSDTKLALVNAIYFAGRWKAPFKKVHEGIFYSPKGEIRTSMMTKNSWCNYYRSDNLDAQLVEVPYEGDGAFFIIILPAKRNGLPALLKQLKLVPDLLNSELARMKKLKVQLTMPKFKIESELDLIKLYQKVGIRNIFQSSGDSGLDGILKGELVSVSSAKQKAVIEVTEIGTEASAASVVQIVGDSWNPHIEIMDCSRPFMFFVVVKHQQLFAGILNSP